MTTESNAVTTRPTLPPLALQDWHSLELAVKRCDGKRVPHTGALGPVDREAYSHNVVFFGFWAGERTVREPTPGD